MRDFTKLDQLIAFAVKYRGKWHTFAHDAATVRLICAGVNLGILDMDEHYSQFTLKSHAKAVQYLGRAVALQYMAETA